MCKCINVFMLDYLEVSYWFNGLTTKIWQDFEF